MKGGLEFSDSEDCIMLERLQKLNFLKLKQVTIVKELLEEAKVSEQSTGRIRSIL
jgi:hypothetical protein